MADTQTLDKAYHVLVSHVVETGQAHYSDLATGLGCSMEEARQLLHDLAEAARHQRGQCGRAEIAAGDDARRDRQHVLTPPQESDMLREVKTLRSTRLVRAVRNTVQDPPGASERPTMADLRGGGREGGGNPPLIFSVIYIYICAEIYGFFFVIFAPI